MPEMIDVAALKTELAAFLKNRDAELTGALKARLDALEQLVGERAVPHAASGKSVSPLAKALASDRVVERLKAVREGLPSTGRIELPGLSLKAVLVTGSPGDSPGDGTVPDRPDRGAIVGVPFRRQRLLEWMQPALPVSAGTFEFVKMEFGDAGIQAGQGELKKETEAGGELKTTAIGTFAHWIQASRQVLDDVPRLQATLSAAFLGRLMQKVENQVVTGNGAGGSDPFIGLWPSATTYVSTGFDPADEIGAAIDEADTAGYIPTGVLLHPRTWGKIRRERASGSGEYVAGGWNSNLPANLWGVDVITSPYATEDEALVIDRRVVTLLDRAAPSIMVSTEDGDNFRRNLVTLLCEARLGLQIADPGGLLRVVLSFDSP